MSKIVDRWSVGFITFAAVMLMVIGIFQALSGLSAIIEDTFYVLTREYAFEFDITAWGWIHLIFGLIVVAAGFYLLRGAAWARIVAIAVAVISAILNIMYIPYYPVSSILIIALCVLVIWALIAHGRELADRA
jgi:hypothetical protein